METEDTSWLSVITALDTHAAPDALLDALLDDVARSHVAHASPQRLEAVPASLLVMRSTSPSSNSSSADGETSENTKPPPKKRKRIRNYRPKNEIDALRQSVADLESLLALARKCHREGRKPAMHAIEQAKEGEYTPSEAMWMGVATRQYKLMRESQVENQQLRAQLLNQLQIVKGLTRLVQRAQMGLPSQAVEWPLVQADTPTLSAKRQELIAVVGSMYGDLENVFADELYQAPRHEFGDVVTNHHEESVIASGEVLSTCRLRRSTPHSVSALSNCIWNGDLTRPITDGTYKLDHIEKESTREVLFFTVRFRTPTGMAKYRGVAARTRIIEDDRHVMLMTSSTWPTESTEAPWNAVGVDMKEWAVFRKVPQSTGGSEAASEVLLQLQASKPDNTRSVMTLEEAAILQAFVAMTVRFSLEQLQRQVDDLLLGQVEVVV